MRVQRLSLVAILSAAVASCTGNGSDGLPVPQNVRVSSMSASEIGLAWTRLDGIDGYRIYREVVGGGSGFVEVGTQPEPLMATFTDGTVTQDVTYNYYVVSYDASSESGRSSEVTVVAAAPYVTFTAPTSSDVLTVGTQFLIEWDTNIPGFDAVISVSTTGGASYTGILETYRSDTPSWSWTVGDDFDGARFITIGSVDCVMAIHHYNDSGWSDLSATFEIVAP